MSVRPAAPSLARGMLILSVAACARDTPTRADAITILYASTENLLGPFSDDSPKFLVFLPLADNRWRCWGRERWEAEHGWPPPGIAASWERSPDARTWTVRLRDELRWHDGVPVTAHDVKFSIDLWKDPEVAWYGGAPVQSVEVLDDRTIRFLLSAPGDWPLQGWDVFLPRHLLAALRQRDFFSWDFWRRPVGNGPYRYVRHIANEMIEFEANPDYRPHPPRIQHLTLRTSFANALTELRSGRADLTAIEPLDAARLAGDSRFQVAYLPGTAAVWLFWNLRRPWFGDPSVRRALAHAVDRRTLHQVLGYPPNLPLTDGLYDDCVLRRGELEDPVPYDPELAVRLLEAAGWRDRDGDGIRDRDGRPFRFEIVLEDQYTSAALVLQDQLRRVGIAAVLAPMENSLVSRRFLSGDFDAAIPRRAGLAQFFGANSPFGYANPRVAELLQARPTAVEDAERERISRELGELTRADLPALFLFPRTQVWAARRHVRGIERLFSTGGMMGVEHLWLEREAAR